MSTDGPAYADTSIFIALFAGSRHALHEDALVLFRRVADGSLRLVLTPVVVGELVYVAAGVLGWTRRATARHLGSLLEAEGLIIREAATLRTALDLYGRYPQLDFADAYLCGAALEAGPAALASFDRDVDRVPGVIRIHA